MSKQLTAQQVYDKVVKHLRKQGHKALNEKGLCMYLAPNGDKCAAGCLLLKREYLPELEQKSFAWILANGAPSIAKRLKIHYDLIRDLQGTHDHCTISGWEEKFQNIAKTHTLTYTPPKVKK
jgi:hypothetical protein